MDHFRVQHGLKRTLMVDLPRGLGGTPEREDHSSCGAPGKRHDAQPDQVDTSGRADLSGCKWRVGQERIKSNYRGKDMDDTACPETEHGNNAGPSTLRYAAAYNIEGILPGGQVKGDQGKEK